MFLQIPLHKFRYTVFCISPFGIQTIRNRPKISSGWIRQDNMAHIWYNNVTVDLVDGCVQSPSQNGNSCVHETSTAGVV